LNKIMPLSSLEQIFYWLVKSLWPLLKQYAIPLIVIWLAAAAIYIVLLIKRLLRTRAEPDITHAHLKLEPCDLPSFRYIQGNFLVTNSGHKPCSLMRVQLLHESMTFDITDISDEIKEDINFQDRGKTGVKLPITINGNKTRRVFFVGSHKIETLEELPDKLSLELTFDCRQEPVTYHLRRESNTKNYV